MFRFILAALAAGKVVELTPATFKSSTDAKSSFVKFLAPW
jgi:hypothetical protein